MPSRTVDIAGSTSTPSELPAEPAPTSRKVYDRSSLDGDYIVMIPRQTSEDFELYAPETRFCEYFEGTIYMPSPVSDRHQEITQFLCHLLESFRWDRPGLIKQVLTGPAVLRLDEEHKPEPDLFIRPAAADSPYKALLVVEVLSPSNRWYDLDFKSEFYRAAGIPEAWYVDASEHVLVVDRTDATGSRRERFETGPVAAAHLPGFWIDLAWLWAESLPDPRRCLEALLAGPPAP